MLPAILEYPGSRLSALEALNMNIVSETWKEIPGTLGGYEASSLGQIRSTGKSFSMHKNKHGRVLKFSIGKHNGYASLSIFVSGEKKRYYVHQLVALAFIGTRPEKSEVNHIDGNRLNNNVSNLEYVTRSQNTIHSYRHLGRKAAVRYGEKHSNAKMNWEKVENMREEYKSVRCYAALAKRYKVDWTTVKSIVNCKTWKPENRI